MKTQIEHVPTARLIPYARNSRTHSDAQVAQIAASIREFGFTNPVLIGEEDDIIAGHGRILAARKLNLEEVPCIRLGHLSETQKRAYVIADNKLALNAGWDEELLRIELKGLEEDGFDLGLVGFTGEEIAALLSEEQALNSDADFSAKTLAERFLAPPFSVLNAREGWWQDRKRSWLALGIKSETGRGGELVGYSEACKKGYAKTISGNASLNKIKPTSINGALDTGTSIFDPVLCELSYCWFCPEGGTIIDPFAGGSVRGVVASKLGRQYIGHELRAEQVSANRDQAAEICGEEKTPPVWVEGDSRNIDKTCADVSADMLFTCPPYADLEVYSDDPADISTLNYNDFRKAYFEILRKACSLLKENSFAVCVVGEVRDKRGNYVDFVGDTVQAFRDAGLEYYNEAILVTSAGSLPIRVGRQFSASRKLGKTHQNVLVFVKGDGKRAAQKCGDCSDSINLEGLDHIDEEEQLFQPQQALQGCA
jgi:DNA modification methylase